MRVDDVPLDGALRRRARGAGPRNGFVPAGVRDRDHAHRRREPGARTPMRALPGARSASANAPCASVCARRAPRSVYRVTTAPAMASRPRSATTSPVARSAATSSTRSASSVPSAVTTRGACEGARTSTRSASPRATGIDASPCASVNAVARSHASVESELALTCAASTGHPRSSTTVTGSGARGSGRTTVISLRAPSAIATSCARIRLVVGARARRQDDGLRQRREREGAVAGGARRALEIPEQAVTTSPGRVRRDGRARRRRDPRGFRPRA